mgnify:CR=1 FL=1
MRCAVSEVRKTGHRLFCNAGDICDLRAGKPGGAKGFRRHLKDLIRCRKVAVSEKGQFGRSHRTSCASFEGWVRLFFRKFALRPTRGVRPGRDLFCQRRRQRALQPGPDSGRPCGGVGLAAPVAVSWHGEGRRCSLGIFHRAGHRSGAWGRGPGEGAHPVVRLWRCQPPMGGCAIRGRRRIGPGPPLGSATNVPVR